MALESSKNYGGIGAILMVIGFLPFAGVFSGLLVLAGLVLVMVGLKGMSVHYNEKGIFDNALYAVIVGVIGAAVFIGVAVVSLAGFLSALGIHMESWTDWAAFQNFNWQGFTDWNVLLPYIATFVADFIVLFVFIVVAAVFVRRSLRSLSEKTGIGLFATTGMMVLVGAILVIAFGLGLLLIWISFILLAVAFFEIKTQPAQPQAPTPPIT